jgi:DsbC/DsbD-like thiol-disulfide interchange protein
MRNLLFILISFLFVDASRSQVIDGVEIVTPRIITGEWDSATKRFPVEVEFTIVKDWHLYWLNPGDAGSPPEVT